MMTDNWHWDRKNPPLWTIDSEELCHDYGFCRTYCSRARHPDGRVHDYHFIDCKDWVQCLALTKNNQLVLVSQFRIGNKALTLELPGGSVDKGETIVHAVHRELAEESGFTGENPVHLGTVYPNPGMQNNQVHFYFLQNCEKTQSTNFDPDEDLATYLLPLEQLDAVISKNTFQSAITLTGILLFQRWLNKNKDI